MSQMDLLTCEFFSIFHFPKDLRSKVEAIFEKARTHPVPALTAATKTPGEIERQDPTASYSWGILVGILVAKNSSDPEFQQMIAEAYSELRTKEKAQ